MPRGVWIFFPAFFPPPRRLDPIPPGSGRFGRAYFRLYLGAFSFLGRARIRSLPKNLGIAGCGIIPGECRQLPGASCRDRAFGKGAAAPPARVCTQMSNPGIPSQRWKTPHPAAAPGVSPGSSPPFRHSRFPADPEGRRVAGPGTREPRVGKVPGALEHREHSRPSRGSRSAGGEGGGAPGIPGKFLSAEFRERDGALRSPDPAGRTALADCWDGKAAAAGGSREIPAAPAATTTPTKPPLSRRE